MHGLVDAIHIKNQVPTAIRGRQWSFQPVDATGEPLAVRLVEGPESARADTSGITWSVDGGFPSSLATMRVAVGPEESPATLAIPVTGRPCSTVHWEGSDEIRHLEPAVAFRFTNGIDRILPGPANERAYVVSGGCRKVTLINLRTMERGPSYTCSTGICSVAVHPSGVLVWHLDGDIVERLSLDDLSPEAIHTADSPIPLAALVSGPSPHAGPPVAVFTGVTGDLVFRELDPESFQLGTPGGIEGLRRGSTSRTTATDYFPVSDDGSVFWIDSNRMTRTAPGKFHREQVNISTRNVPVTITGAGKTLLAGTNGYDQETQRTWSLNLEENAQTHLFRDYGNTHLVGLTKWRDQQRITRYRIHLIDHETRGLTCRIEGFPEWRGNDRLLNDSSCADFAVQLYSSANTLLTVPQDRLHLLARRLPASQDR